ncbi:uncharacterized protein B0T15DRAFT_528463 [Chaetomium strumarium]|uniref:EamA domain-containing protein n=1 Tax=Chaetomium strumarium TaxID=1170767 RepID=A0AAJ0GVZ6_9PEZI|nr:hypothetical protein B0T15DRAFT_528463 [Chaetomium strumarium]
MPTLRPRKRQSEAPTATTRSEGVITASASAVPSPPNIVNRKTPGSAEGEKQANTMSLPDEERPLLGGPSAEDAEVSPASSTWTKRNQWIVFALASGACAAFNGVFAKLTTTELTAGFSLAIARMLDLESIENIIELVVRGTFFGLNLAFNGVMWTLFTTALARGHSTTQVSIMNTSSNFVITAILGFVIFSEALPPLWWLGAAMLVAGNVIVGKKDEAVSMKEDELSTERAVPVSPSTDGLSTVRSGGGEQTDRVLEGHVKNEDVLDLGTEGGK